MNPGGSVKDRAAQRASSLDAEQRGALAPGGTVVEGTAGNTGIGLAHVCNARGYRCVIVMPDNQSPEKYRLLEMLGAEVHKVPAVPYSNPNQYQKVAQRLAGSAAERHLVEPVRQHRQPRTRTCDTTGPEIWAQTNGRVDAFVAASGTGGTFAGVSEFLKSRRRADPLRARRPARQQPVRLRAQRRAEGHRLRLHHRGHRHRPHHRQPRRTRRSMTRCTSRTRETVRFVYRLLHEEGLFLGSTSGINVAAAVRVARELGPGHTHRHGAVRRRRQIPVAPVQPRSGWRTRGWPAPRPCAARAAPLSLKAALVA